jgi:hypothetical protein
MSFFKLENISKQLDFIMPVTPIGANSNLINIKNFSELRTFPLGIAYFVDGGHQEIFSKGDQSFYLLRFAYVKFNETKRVEQKVFETFIKINTSCPFNFEFSKELPFFKSSSYIINNRDLINCKNIQDCDVEAFINRIRRIMELKLSIDIIKKMNEGEMIVLDGSIYPNDYDFEEIKDLVDLVPKKKIELIGFSKNSLIKSNSGSILNEEILTFSKNINFNKWVCIDVFSESSLNINTSYAYLHPLSDFCFRIDHLSNPILPLERLSSNSSDGSFLGYPYGLIIVDKLARVKNEEKAYIYSKYFLSKDLREKQNPHEILDNM